MKVHVQMAVSDKVFVPTSGDKDSFLKRRAGANSINNKVFKIDPLFVLAELTAATNEKLQHAGIFKTSALIN